MKKKSSQSRTIRNQMQSFEIGRNRLQFRWFAVVSPTGCFAYDQFPTLLSRFANVSKVVSLTFEVISLPSVFSFVFFEVATNEMLYSNTA